MSTPQRHEQLLRDLAELKLHRIAELYQEVLDEAARKQSSMLDVLAGLIGAEAAARRQRALERRIDRARLPKRKTLEEYDFTFPKRLPKQAVLRLFDCDFVAQHACGILIGPTGTGKSHLLNAYSTSTRNFSSSMSWAICPSTNAVRTCCSRSSPPGMNPARSWSPRTEPSGTGAQSSTWTTPWPPP